MRSTLDTPISLLSGHKIIEFDEIKQRCAINLPSLFNAVSEPGKGDLWKAREWIARITARHLVALSEFVNLVDNMGALLLIAPIEQRRQSIFHRCRQVLLKHRLAQLVQLGAPQIHFPACVKNAEKPL